MARDAYYNKLIQTKRWRLTRRMKLSQCPCCEDCRREGVIEPATEIHHITPAETAKSAEEMERLMFQPDNLAALCHDCHVKRHVKLRSRTKEVRAERVNDEVERFKNKYL